MTDLNIQIADSVETAPHYKTEPVEGFMAQPAEFIKALIAPKGTKGGRATVDFQIRIKDKSGTTVGVAVVALTGGVIRGLANVITAAEKEVCPRDTDGDGDCGQAACRACRP